MMVLAHRHGPGRYVLIQAAVLLCVFLLLAVTPAPVTFPSGPWEVVLLLKGAAALLVTDLLLIGFTSDRTRRSQSNVKTSTTSVDLADATRIGHYHVEDSGGVIGIVDEVIGDRGGTPRALVVTDGWFGRRRFLVPLQGVRGIDESNRLVVIDDRTSF